MFLFQLYPSCNYRIHTHMVWLTKGLPKIGHKGSRCLPQCELASSNSLFHFLSIPLTHTLSLSLLCCRRLLLQQLLGKFSCFLGSCCNDLSLGVKHCLSSPLVLSLSLTVGWKNGATTFCLLYCEGERRMFPPRAEFSVVPFPCSQHFFFTLHGLPYSNVLLNSLLRDFPISSHNQGLVGFDSWRSSA